MIIICPLLKFIGRTSAPRFTKYISHNRQSKKDCNLQSVKAADVIKEIQKSNGKTESTVLQLIQSCPTRWNSIFFYVGKISCAIRNYIKIIITTRKLTNDVN